ncbi:SRPBCC domain-containing protein [Mesorhizobium sp. INR15]|uniref:SRPBCC family protein n=1 Tax=Mesorhizobium sp. INR15 TaxID=2654248 RepID=UPI001896A471|nr:SRPBCC domain-containing protein [Mesorhizobium sp. INR15]QPC92792.1 ATPase [Mesorhizobium sp. INR15]
MTEQAHSTSRAKAAPDAIEFTCDLPEPPEKVWRALTVPELLAAWMMPNDIKPEIGNRFAFAKADAPIECQVLDAEPGRLLRYSWREKGSGREKDTDTAFDSIVTFTLDRTTSGGTHLRIIHGGFALVAHSSITVAGADCRLSLRAASSTTPALAANSPYLMSLAA